MTGDEIRALRERLGWTKADLARELGCNLASVWRWETGAFSPMGVYARALERLDREAPASEVYVKTTEAARRLGIAPQTVGAWIRRGKLRAVRLRLGTRQRQTWLVLERDVVELEVSA